MGKLYCILRLRVESKKDILTLLNQYQRHGTEHLIRVYTYKNKKKKNQLHVYKNSYQPGKNKFKKNELFNLIY